MLTELRKEKVKRENQRMPAKAKTKGKANRRANRLERRVTTALARAMVFSRTVHGEVNKTPCRILDGPASLTVQTRVQRVEKDRKAKILARTIRHVTDVESLVTMQRIVGFVW
jgi:hypothetical protein